MRAWHVTHRPRLPCASIALCPFANIAFRSSRFTVAQSSPGCVTHQAGSRQVQSQAGAVSPRRSRRSLGHSAEASLSLQNERAGIRLQPATQRRMTAEIAVMLRPPEPSHSLRDSVRMLLNLRCAQTVRRGSCLRWKPATVVFNAESTGKSAERD